MAIVKNLEKKGPAINLIFFTKYTTIAVLYFQKKLYAFWKSRAKTPIALYN